MSTRILILLLETVFFVLISAALLRAYMTWLRVPQIGQPARFVLAVSDFLVKPLQRLFPKSWLRLRFDGPSLLAAVLLTLAYSLAWSALVGAWPHVLNNWVAVVPFLAIKMLIRVSLQTLMLLVLAYAVLAWTQASSVAVSSLARLVDPLLAPLRRLLPPVGGVDLSALLLLVLLQIAMIIFV